MNRPSTAKSPKPFSIRLSEIPLDEKAAFVHSVCAALIDSRLGPGRSTRLIIDLRETPHQAPAVFCEATPTGPVPCYAILPDSEITRRYVEDEVLRELAYAENEFAVIRGQPLSPSTLGRGSP